MRVSVTLHGNLAQFQPSTSFEVSTPKELFRAIARQTVGFETELIETGKRGQNYQVVLNNEKELSEKELDYPFSEDCHVDLLPVVEGEGNIGKIIGGIGLIALGAFTGGVGFISGSTLILTGGALALQGVAGLFGSPKPDDEDTRGKQSFLFNGAVNVAPSTGRVPVVYGCGYKAEGFITGSLVVSAGIRAYSQEDEEDDTPIYAPGQCSTEYRVSVTYSYTGLSSDTDTTVFDCQSDTQPFFGPFGALDVELVTFPVDDTPDSEIFTGVRINKKDEEGTPGIVYAVLLNAAFYTITSYSTEITRCDGLADQCGDPINE